MRAAHSLHFALILLASGAHAARVEEHTPRKLRTEKAQLAAKRLKRTVAAKTAFRFLPPNEGRRRLGSEAVQFDCACSEGSPACDDQEGWWGDTCEGRTRFCNAGYMADSESNGGDVDDGNGGFSSCLLCSPGFHCPQRTFGQDTTCTACPSGGVAKRPCKAGRYCLAGQSNAEGTGPCAAGYFCPAGSASAIGAGKCAFGYRCAPGSSTRTGQGFCEAGTACVSTRP